MNALVNGIPSRRRGAEGEENESVGRETNNKAPLIIPDLNRYRCVFITLHPYKKHKSFIKNKILSKVSDRLRKHMHSFIMVREPNTVEGSCHYHAFGYIDREKELVMTGFKVWCKTVTDSNLDRPDYERVADRFAEFHYDYDNKHRPPMTWEVEKAIYAADYGSDISRAVGRAKRSIAEQTTSILDYMFKLDPKDEYVDYIRVQPKSS